MPGKSENNVKVLRIKANLTQAELARKAGISQQQIQRIETGQAAKVNIAQNICRALQQTMAEVFPNAPPRSGSEPLINYTSLSRIDSDASTWSAKVLFKGGNEGLLHMSLGDMQRLQNYLNSRSLKKMFFCLEHDGWIYALNLQHVLLASILHDAGKAVEEGESVIDAKPPSAWDHSKAGGIRISFADGSKRQVFAVEDGLIGELVSDLDAIGEYQEAPAFVSFMDENRDDVFLCMRDILLIEIPVVLLEPEAAEYQCTENL